MSNNCSSLTRIIISHTKLFYFTRSNPSGVIEEIVINPNEHKALFTYCWSMEQVDLYCKLAEKERPEEFGSVSELEQFVMALMAGEHVLFCVFGQGC